MSVPHSEQASPLLVKDGYFSAKGRKTSPNPDESSTSFFFTHFVQRGVRKQLLALLCLVTLACGSTPILVGPTRAITDPAAAIASLTAGGTIIIDDGVYNTYFDIPNNVPGFTIRSASGNAYNCVLNGQGGVGSGHRLSYGKGVIHTQSPGTIIGIGFIGGGGTDGSSDGEAGLYAENFATLGLLTVKDCAFDNNENGIFVPNYNPDGVSGGNNVDLLVQNSVFSYKQPNAIVPDGAAHNVYIQGHSFTSIDNIWFPSKYGNNLKSRARTTYVQDVYNRQDQGRTLDIPSGGQLTVRGGVYVANGAVGNFFEYAAENSDSGLFKPDIQGMIIYGGRYNEGIWNYGSSSLDFVGTIQYWLNAGASFYFQGTVTGIVTSPPAGTVFVSAPQPTLPAWTRNPTSSTTSQSSSSSSSSSTTGTPPTPKPTLPPTPKPTLPPTPKPTLPPTPVPTPAPTQAPTCGAPFIGQGTGLLGSYYNGVNFDKMVLARPDPSVNFNWQQQSPAYGVNADYFSARWTGSFVAKYTGVHTFTTSSDDGNRLFIDNNAVLNDWSDHSSRSASGTYTLVAGKSYAIRFEFYDAAVDASVSLSWSHACMPTAEVIPTSQLYLPPVYSVCYSSST